MNKNYISKALIIILLSAFQHSYAAEQRVIKVGAFDSFPLIYKDNDGAIKGFYTDLLAEIGHQENIRFEYIFGSWQDGLDRIKTGEVDMLTSAGYTNERSQYMDYCINPLLTVWGELYTLKSSEISGIFEIKNRKIGALRSDIFLKNFVELAGKLGIRYELVELSSYEDVFKAVADGTVDAGIVDVTFGTAKNREYRLRSSGIVFNPLDIFFTTGKGKNAELRQLLDKYLDEWKHQEVSVYSKAKQKWLYGSVGAVTVMPGWLINILITLGFFTLIALVFIVLLKLQVKRATDKIRQREEALRKSEENFKAIIDTIPLAIHLSAGIEQKSLYVNPTMVRLFGYTIEDIPSVKEWWPLAYPDDNYRKKISEAWNDKVRNAIDTQSSIEPMETVITCSDGTKKNISWGYITLGDINYSWGLDLTERKRAEAEIKIKNEELEALNEELNGTIEEMEATNEELTATYEALLESEEKIHSISNNIQSGMIYQAVINKDGSRKFTYLSDSVKRLYGITPEEGMADPSLIYRRVNEEDAGRLMAEEEYAIKTLSTFKTEIRINHPSGDTRWSSFVSIPRMLNDGLICFDGIEFDITEQKTAQERINNLLKEKELLLQEVHHRIKNNMNTIKGLLTLQLTAEDNPSVAASLRDAESRVQSMIMLYDRLYCTDNYRELSVKDYLQSLAEEIIGSFPNRGIVKIETSMEDFILNISLLTPLGIIVNELLTNMMKYAFKERESGVLKLSAAVENNSAKIVIQDNGIGIPESVSFENHSGFGLELVRLLVDQINGNIRIERGEGTKFMLEFEV